MCNVPSEPAPTDKHVVFESWDSCGSPSSLNYGPSHSDLWGCSPDSVRSPYPSEQTLQSKFDLELQNFPSKHCSAQSIRSETPTVLDSVSPLFSKYPRSPSSFDIFVLSRSLGLKPQSLTTFSGYVCVSPRSVHDVYSVRYLTFLLPQRH